ncbi:aminomethyltransferase, mitochondrial-like [Saccoglossus kowalevskii]|uniref:Aminomethyltransferase n=1 Tax=Saccoglossus kowalevskii TaxID=10224 RepID=A0ABM0GW53_SACKO|nr:PREDICTED: aminomethyltransferase, mitochondrial-like [Saccoglossus kowalevskii]
MTDVFCWRNKKMSGVRFSSLLPRLISRGTKWNSQHPMWVTQRLFASEADVDLTKTCLYDFHLEHGGKMVPFAGFSMPVQYKEGLLAEHLHTRNTVSLFDVSHMQQSKVYGKDRIQFIESLIVGDVAGLPDNTGTLSLFTNHKGGIQDDLIVSKTTEDYLYIVSNAGCIDKDIANMKAQEVAMKSQGFDVTFEPITDRALLALQGPLMTKVLQNGIRSDLKDFTFMKTAEMSVYGVPNCRVTRCGYTGEDGVEISIPIKHVLEVVDSLMSCQLAEVKLAGLGARDSLRLEAGLCLYGNDIDEDTTPIEATLAWTIAKRRRQESNFPGAEIILKQLKEKPKRKRVGIVSSGPPARAGTQILDESGEPIGHLTSGCPSPTLKKNVAMGYVTTKHAKNGTKLKLQVRKKQIDAQVCKMPFVPTKYYTGK